jgi:hypothetical protein
MKLDEIPQDVGGLANANMKELCYGVDENGEYKTTVSEGWDVKTLVLNKSLELIEERVADFKQQCLDGKTSPIPYYMELNRMDLLVLSDYMGKWRWIIKRHFKPSVFKKLSQKTLEKYAETFKISVEQLKDITL